MPGFVFKKGNVGIISKSGTLTYEAADQVVREGFGISTAIGIGGDPIIGTTTKDAVELFMNDPETEAIVMIGEIGGQLEAEAAQYVKATGNKNPLLVLSLVKLLLQEEPWAMLVQLLAVPMIQQKLKNALWLSVEFM